MTTYLLTASVCLVIYVFSDRFHISAAAIIHKYPVKPDTIIMKASLFNVNGVELCYRHVKCAYVMFCLTVFNSDPTKKIIMHVKMSENVY